MSINDGAISCVDYIIQEIAYFIREFKEETEEETVYMYPDNLKAKATLWLWELRDLGIIGIGLLISVFALSQLGFMPPIVITAVYAFLTIKFEDTSILSFIRYACAFFLLKQQIFEWRL